MEEKKKTSSKNNNQKKNNQHKKNNQKKNYNNSNNKPKQNIVKEEVKKEKVVLEEVKEEVEIKDNEKEVKIEQQKKENLKLEKIFCIIVAVMFGILLILCFFMQEFIPATLITLSLELFSIAYFISEENEKDKRVYIFFSIGIVILFAAIIYTLAKIT